MSRQPARYGGPGSDMTRGFSEASWGLSVAFGFVGVVLLFWFAGRLLDGWLGIEPWAQVLGAAGGWIIGIFVVYYAVQTKERPL